MKRLLRILFTVVGVAGVLLLVWVGVTLLWQEPWTAYQNHREQGKLNVQLDHPPKRVIDRKPLPGDAIGQLIIPAIDQHPYVVEGTDSESLAKGPGHYPDSALPGQRGTVAIAGHRTTHGAPFRNIDDLRPGDRIILDMPYGRYVYRVVRVRVVSPEDTYVVQRKVRYDRLALSACHPPYSAAQRIIVFAKLSKVESARIST